MKYAKSKALRVLLLLAASSLVAGLIITPAAAQPTPTLYYVPQAGSTWVNKGVAGAGYNAYVSTPGLFRTQSNGYPYWGDMGQSDFISIPAGSATNNLNAASWEIGFHYAGLTSQRFQKIWDKAYGAFMIEIDTDYNNDRHFDANQGYLTIYRATTGGSHARWYIPMDTVLRTGHDYYVQIAWDSRAGPGNEPYPAIWIGEDGNAPVRQTRWDETGGALEGYGSWYNDAVGNANLGNTAANSAGSSVKTAWLNGGFYVYRQYNSIVDFSNGGSWNTDKVAWTGATTTVKPTATPASKVTPTTKPTVKPTAKPTTKPVVKAVAKPVVKATAAKQVVKAVAKPVVKATAAKQVVQASVKPTASKSIISASEAIEDSSVPGITVPSAQTNSVASEPAQPVLEFSLLGLGIPALLAGLVYLLMRR